MKQMRPSHNMETFPTECLDISLGWTRAPHVRLVCKTWYWVWARREDRWEIDERVVVANVRLAHLYSQLLPCSGWLCDVAAAAGSLDVLQWARMQGYPWWEGTCTGAAKGGHLAVLKYLRRSGCPWGEGALLGAAEEGHLWALSWLRRRGCPWSNRVCEAAAGRGRLRVLQWAHLQGCAWSRDRCCLEAATHGHLEVLEWCLVEEPGEDQVSHLLAAALGAQQPGVVDWLSARWPAVAQMQREFHAAALPCRPPICDARFISETHYILAARDGDLALVQWYCAQGYPRSPYSKVAAIVTAATHGRYQRSRQCYPPPHAVAAWTSYGGSTNTHPQPARRSPTPPGRPSARWLWPTDT
jgi:hypothetical protein